MKSWRYMACVGCLLMVLLCSGNAALAVESLPDTSQALGEQVTEATDSDPNDATPKANTPAELLPVRVAPLDDTELDLSLLYGARIVVPEGTRYYASSDLGGSGAFGTIGNRYTPMGANLYIGGFSRLSDSQRLEKGWRAYNPQYVPVAEHWSVDGGDILWDNIWVSFYTDPASKTLTGWLPARAIAVINGILGDGKTNAAYRNGVEIVEKDPFVDVAPPGAQTAGPVEHPEQVLERIDPNLIDEALQSPGQIDPGVVDNLLRDPGNAIEDRVIRDQDTSSGDATGVEDDGYAVPYYRDVSDKPFISTREIAYAIEDYTEDGDKVAFLMDASGSVMEYMEDIAVYGTYVDKANKADIIIAFADGYKVIRAEEYLDAELDRGGTDIYSAVNALEDAASYDRIIIVTDTQHNISESALNTVAEFTGKIVVVCPGDWTLILESTVQDIEAAFDTTVYLCRLDDQLEQMRVLELLKQQED